MGEQRRKREAMDLLVSEISKGEEENIANSIRVAIEVIINDLACYLLYIPNLYACNIYREDGCPVLWTACQMLNEKKKRK